MTEIRALTTDEWRRLRLARMAAVEAMPYFARALFALAPVAAPGLGTFAVDRHWRLYLDLRNPIASNAFGSPTVSVTIREKPKGSTVLDLIPCFGDVVRRGGHDWQTSAYQVNYEGTQHNWCIAQFWVHCTVWLQMHLYGSMSGRW